MEGILPNSFYEARTTLIQKTKIQLKRRTIGHLLNDINVKILNKIMAN
jgi:hypothetical protein